MPQSIEEKKDSLTVENSNPDSTLFIPLSQFTFAGNPRYTIDGSLPGKVTKIKPVTSAIVGTIYAGAFIGLHLHQQKAWWSGQRGKFHIIEDWGSALQVDKIGHAYGGFMMSYMCGEALIASGIGIDEAAVLGFVLGTGYQTYVEYEDGFARDWGFSPSDFYFDVIGGLYYLAQYHVPALQNIAPKWQYIPSEWVNKPVIDRPRTFVDDYNSSTFWLSVKLYNLLPDQYKKYWLPWLNVAVGYGGDAIDAKIDPNGPPDQLSHRRYVIGLDYDIVALLPDGGSFWNWWKQNLNTIKFPGPAIEFSSSGTRVYVVYPFRIKL